MIKQTTQLAATALISLSLVSTAIAREQEGGFYVAPSFGYYFFDSDRNVEHDPAIGLGLGYEFNRVWAFQLMGEAMDLEAKQTRGDIDARYWHGDVLYHMGDNETWRPYVIAGAGDLRTEADGARHERETIYNAGLGLKHEISENMDVRMEARGLYGHDNSTTDGTVQVGFNYLFGGKSKPVEEPAPEIEEPKDSDGDGVYDEDDRCPDTPRGTKVDASGCPLPIADGDKDGVTDDKDQCPATPAGAKVDEQGCHLQLKETLSMRLNVLFELNKAEVQKEYMPEVEKLATFLREYPDTNVVIEGHTDSLGSDAYNMKLSKSRAETVRNHLVEYFSIDPGRVTAVGYGETRPIETNATAEGRDQNRRVVAVVSATTTKVQMK